MTNFFELIIHTLNLVGLILLYCVAHKHVNIQGSAKRWALGWVNSAPMARGSQEAGFTQPSAHL